jgi:hypothetical protein
MQSGLSRSSAGQNEQSLGQRLRRIIRDDLVNPGCGG